jgi:hypothetical protein
VTGENGWIKYLKKQRNEASSTSEIRNDDMYSNSAPTEVDRIELLESEEALKRSRNRKNPGTEN